MYGVFDPNNASLEWYDPNSVQLSGDAEGLMLGEHIFVGDDYTMVIGASELAESASVTVAANELSTDSDNLADPMIFSEQEVEAALAHNELEVTDSENDDDDVDYDSVYYKGSFAVDPSAKLKDGVRLIDNKPVVTGSRLLFATEATIQSYCLIQEVQFNDRKILVAFLKPEKVKQVFYPLTRAQGLQQIYDIAQRLNQLPGTKGIPALAAACHINGECGYGNLSGIGAYGNLGNFQYDLISNAKAINKKWPFIMKGSDVKPVEGKDVRYMTGNVVHDDLEQAVHNYIRWMYKSQRAYWKSFYKTFATARNKAEYVEAFMLDLAARGYFTGTVSLSKEKWSEIVGNFANLIEFTGWIEDFNLIKGKLQSYFDSNANTPKLAAEMRSWFTTLS